MTSPRIDFGSKILPDHLDRKAYVYIRQSSPRQVWQHPEGRRRQYQLVDWVEQLGWDKERIVVIDEDQGKSATIARSRSGFEQTAMAVGRSEVGIVVRLG